MKTRSLYTLLLFVFLHGFVCIATSYAQQSKITKKNSKRTSASQKAKKLKEGAAGDEGTYKKYNIKSPRPESRQNVTKIDLTPATVKKKSTEMKESGTGDEKPREIIGFPNVNTSQKILIVDHAVANRRNKAAELKESGSGDRNTPGPRTKPNLTKGIKPMEMIDNQAETRKRNSTEATGSSGDLVNAYEKMKQQEQSKGKQAGSFAGKLSADVLTANKDKIKSGDREMGQNQGDIIGTYLDKRNRERAKSKQIANYTGTIDLAKIKLNVKENSHRQAINSGDILAKSVKARQNDIRSRSRKAADYRGEMLVTARRKGSHPSSVSTGATSAGSYAAKEKARKKAIMKARKNRDVEDPAYMKKNAPRPRYETEEYKIWENKTRD